MNSPSNAIDSQKGKSFVDHLQLTTGGGTKDIVPHGRGFRITGSTAGNIHFLNEYQKDVTMYCLAGVDYHHGITKFFSDSAVDFTILY